MRPSHGEDPVPGQGEETAWLDAREQLVWRALLRGNSLLMVALDDALTQAGLRMAEYEILSMLSEAPDRRLRMSMLADQVVQSRSRLTHTATRLESQGLVQRRRIREDGRGVELMLTGDGQAMVDRLAPMHVRGVRAGFVDLMSAEEMQVVTDVMRRVVAVNRTSQTQALDAL